MNVNQYFRLPVIAVPILRIVEPSSKAIFQSPDMPILKSPKGKYLSRSILN